jgi:hypothetical protein
MVYLGRTDLLDAAGGSEVVPAYPANMRIMTGAEQLRCMRLSAKGMFRWSTHCCNSPVGNTSPGMPWIGVHRNMYTVEDPKFLERTLGEIKSSIMGRFAIGPVPPGTPNKMSFRAIRSVLPFLLKGVLTRKALPSPFFKADGKAPITEPTVLTAEQRAQLADQWHAKQNARR